MAADAVEGIVVSGKAAFNDVGEIRTPEILHDKRSAQKTGLAVCVCVCCDSPFGTSSRRGPRSAPSTESSIESLRCQVRYQSSPKSESRVEAGDVKTTRAPC